MTTKWLTLIYLHLNFRGKLFVGIQWILVDFILGAYNLVFLGRCLQEWLIFSNFSYLFLPPHSSSCSLGANRYAIGVFHRGAVESNCRFSLLWLASASSPSSGQPKWIIILPWIWKNWTNFYMMCPFLRFLPTN